MNMIALQIQLPAEPALDAGAVARITGATKTVKQIAWLKQNHWRFELDDKGTVVIGNLYAQLRLAGLNPADVATEPAGAGAGFDLSKTR